MDNHHGAPEMRLSLVDRLLVYVRVAHKGKQSNWKVVILDGRREILDKLGQLIASWPSGC